MAKGEDSRRSGLPGQPETMLAGLAQGASRLLESIPAVQKHPDQASRNRDLQRMRNIRRRSQGRGDPPGMKRSMIAKMDALRPCGTSGKTTFSGQFWLVPVIAKMDTLARNLERAVGILRKVIDQTVRRVIKREKVPASEKVVSFFEEHTDIIVKGRRDTQYGHKVFLTGRRLQSDPGLPDRAGQPCRQRPLSGSARTAQRAVRQSAASSERRWRFCLPKESCLCQGA